MCERNLTTNLIHSIQFKFIFKFGSSFSGCNGTWHSLQCSFNERLSAVRWNSGHCLHPQQKWYSVYVHYNSFFSHGHLSKSCCRPGHRGYIKLLKNCLAIFLFKYVFYFLLNCLVIFCANYFPICHCIHFCYFLSFFLFPGRYLFLNAVANQLRYPNSHTHYFSCVLLYLFAEANTEAIQEQITRYSESDITKLLAFLSFFFLLQTSLNKDSMVSQQSTPLIVNSL